LIRDLSPIIKIVIIYLLNPL